MSKRTIENCRVITKAIKEQIGIPKTEWLNGKEYCQGYQKSECDDEPYYKCMNCHLNIFNQNN